MNYTKTHALRTHAQPAGWNTSLNGWCACVQWHNDYALILWKRTRLSSMREISWNSYRYGSHEITSLNQVSILLLRLEYFVLYRCHLHAAEIRIYRTFQTGSSEAGALNLQTPVCPGLRRALIPLRPRPCLHLNRPVR